MKLVLVFVYLSFIALGLPDGMFGVAWSTVREEMGLPIEWAGFVVILHSCFYSLTSSQLGRISKRLQAQHINLIGLGLMVLGFTAMALAPSPIFLAATTLFTGTGMGLVDSSLNSYMAKNFSARYMNWLHCFWGMGASLGPLIMTQALLMGNWRLGYVSVAAVQLLVLFIVAVSIARKVWHKKEGAAEETPLKNGPLTQKRYQAAAVAIFFLYTGAEYSFGFWMPSVLLESRGLPQEAVGMFPAVYFAGIMLGRMAAGLFANRFTTMTILRAGFALSLAGAALLVFTNSIIGAAMVGLGFAPIFPCLIDATAARFAPKIVTRLIGFQVAAAGAGVAIVSSSVGQVLGRISLEALFPVVIALVIGGLVLNEALSRARTKISSSA